MYISLPRFSILLVKLLRGFVGEQWWSRSVTTLPWNSSLDKISQLFYYWWLETMDDKKTNRWVYTDFVFSPSFVLFRNHSWVFLFVTDIQELMPTKWRLLLSKQVFPLLFFLLHSNIFTVVLAWIFLSKFDYREVDTHQSINQMRALSCFKGGSMANLCRRGE